MDVIYTINDLTNKINEYKGQSIGFVPTMGFLHDGHISLAETACKEMDITVMSIFVNPLQFGPNEDFDRYPRDEEADRLKAERAGIDILFIPSVQEMYPNEMSIQMTISKGADVLCGRTRPGHFDGVATVLTKLFHLVEPDKAYFGLKDAQQFAIVLNLINEFNFQTSLVGLPTVRESDGLAKSSRNVYLSEKERNEAVNLYKALKTGQQVLMNGEKATTEIIHQVNNYIKKHIEHGNLDYLSILSYSDLNEIDVIGNETVIIAIAVQYGQARLIDNLILQSSGEQIFRFEYH